MDSELKEKIRAYILENFLFGDTTRTFGDWDSLLGKGIIDSTGVLELVAHLQESYGITVEDEEIMPDNLDSVTNLAAYIQRKTAMVSR